MKHAFATAALLALFAAPAGAACYADYKAKQDNPLQLHYGVARINGDCTKPAATKELRSRIASQGWTLLTVLTVFDDSGLAQRKKSAGQYYLRY
ncbi:hypothetical protein IV417_10465 [Alphaproteobacteria bacterium KMM 3653]|uniref:DUF4177 domain-containing protein n=1 Tax=Harenicola maris TaxID=2841044 RepID=A0AAP2CUB8_9RHOB|nr:hypothetical protein [Harenicola maris]